MSSSSPSPPQSFDGCLAAANELFVAEEYDTAAPLYDAALQQQPASTPALIARAANSIKLKRYQAALSDADAALRSDSNNSLALYRRATALFYLDDFTAALSAFRQAEALGSKQSALFIRKCEAELLRRNQSRTAAAAPKATDTAQPAIAAAHAAPIGTGGEARSGGNGNGSSGVSTAGVSQSAGVSLSSRVTESWFQSRETVTVTLFAKKLAKDAVRASVDPSTPHLLSARVELPDGSVLNKQWSLFGAVQPDDVAVHVTAYKVELLLHKQSEEEWLGLLDTDRRAVEGVVKRDNVVREEAPVSSYPTSSRKKVEWSEVESAASKQEEDDKPQGDAALQKLFQTIYKDANEDTRRAMVKSFQTSGGTVLSTNWKEVKETDYTRNREAPTGMEFKDWNNPST